MTTTERNLLLMTGIPGTGKTSYGNAFAQEFGFVHVDLETTAALSELAADPSGFIEGLIASDRQTVVTWGFLPNEAQTAIVNLFRAKGFQLIWLDGNRGAALRAFQHRNTVPEELFYLQMYRIEQSKVIDQIKPVIINPFHKSGFKSPRRLLKEILSSTDT